MICAVIKGPTYDEARRQIATVHGIVDLVEFRLDLFQTLDLNALRALRCEFSIPTIFTLRSRFQGGEYCASERDRLDDIHSLAALTPEYFDLEYNIIDINIIRQFNIRHPKTKVILSYHNFDETPKDLDSLYRQMRMVPADFYKIAVMAKNSVDALRFICWARHLDNKLIAVSMGTHGQISRIIAPMIGSPFTYASLDNALESLTGQLSVSTLIERYRQRKLSPSTVIYGLIGDPVSQSPSDVTHNQWMADQELDTIYVKFQVREEELADFLRYAKKLPIRGLSVTMPLKEAILPYLDKVDPLSQEIGAVNTLILENEQIKGFNTDGIGALNAIGEVLNVKNKQIVIIGAGGAAKAIAYEAKRRGGLVTIVNRDIKRAFELASRLSCKVNSFNDLSSRIKSKCDVLVNCTPIDILDIEGLNPETLVMDIRTKLKVNRFLEIAKSKGCPIIYGHQMFTRQALGQFEHWFHPCLHSQGYKPHLNMIKTQLAP